MDSTVPLATREDLEEAIVMTPRTPSIMEGTPALEAFRAALATIAEGETKRVILDFSEVEFLSSACLGNLITARRKLRSRGQTFAKPCQRRGSLFAFFPDREAALAACRLGETDPLLLCSVSKEIMEVFCIC